MVYFNSSPVGWIYEWCNSCHICFLNLVKLLCLSFFQFYKYETETACASTFKLFLQSKYQCMGIYVMPWLYHRCLVRIDAMNFFLLSTAYLLCFTNCFRTLEVINFYIHLIFFKILCKFVQKLEYLITYIHAHVMSLSYKYRNKNEDLKQHSLFLCFCQLILAILP